MFRVVSWVVLFAFLGHFGASVFFPYALVINPHHNHYTIGEVSEETLHNHEQNHHFTYNNHEETTPLTTGVIVSVFENTPTFTLSFFKLGLATIPFALTLIAIWVCLFTLRPGYQGSFSLSLNPLLPPPR